MIRATCVATKVRGKLQEKLSSVTAPLWFHAALASPSSTYLHLSFQKFNEIIDKSKAEADRAEANIPEIERLINLANNKSDEANANLGDAQERAEQAQSTAKEARDTADRAKQVSAASCDALQIKKNI